MKIIKNSEELAKLVNEHKDLILPNEDVRIEFEPTKDEIGNVECRDLFLMNDEEKFSFNGRNFYGLDFNGRDFNGWNFYGLDFNGRNFNGTNFYGRDFNGANFYGGDFYGANFYGLDFKGWNFYGTNFKGGKVSYHAFFNAYGYITCESIEGRRTPHANPVCLDGQLMIVKPEDDATEEAMKLLKEKGYRIVKD